MIYPPHPHGGFYDGNNLLVKHCPENSHITTSIFKQYSVSQEGQRGSVSSPCGALKVQERSLAKTGKNTSLGFKNSCTQAVQTKLSVLHMHVSTFSPSPLNLFFHPTSFFHPLFSHLKSANCSSNLT